jgi:hypothetical protein
MSVVVQVFGAGMMLYLLGEAASGQDIDAQNTVNPRF